MSISQFNKTNSQLNLMPTRAHKINQNQFQANQNNLIYSKLDQCQGTSFCFMVHCIGWQNDKKLLQDPLQKQKSMLLMNVSNKYSSFPKSLKTSISNISSCPKQQKCIMIIWPVFNGPKTLLPKTFVTSKYAKMLSENLYKIKHSKFYTLMESLIFLISLQKETKTFLTSFQSAIKLFPSISLL